jgi:anaerobic magnesium-protoporphyrin IX monomethyl ester cyclase
MRIFLGNPPWQRTGWYGVRAGSRWPHFEREGSRYMPFPFYMAYASSLLQQAGHQTKLIDGCAERCSDGSFFQRFDSFAPDVALLEISSASLEVDIRIVRELRKSASKDLRIVWVGAHSWTDGQPDILTAVPEVDFFLKGEYEYSLLALVEAFGKSKDFSKIPGLLYRGADGRSVQNPEGKLHDIDTYPWPDRDQLPIHRYVEAWGALPQPNLQLWASRGCPFRCDFCIWPQFMYGGRNYRIRDVDDIIAEIKHCVDRYGMKSVYFDDDTFNIGKPRLKRFAERLKAECPGIQWGLMGRADTFDRETFRMLVHSGLKFIKFGVESGNQALVDSMEKGLKLERVRESMAWAKELGVITHLTFSFGHPGETWETAEQTINFALELSPDSIQFSLMQPFPGSALYDKAVAGGLLVSEDLSKFDGYSTTPMRTESLSANDLEQILVRANERWRQHQRSTSWRPTGLRQLVRRGLEKARQAF